MKKAALISLIATALAVSSVSALARDYRDNDRDSHYRDQRDRFEQRFERGDNHRHHYRSEYRRDHKHWQRHQSRHHQQAPGRML